MGGSISSAHLGIGRTGLSEAPPCNGWSRRSGHKQARKHFRRPDRHGHVGKTGMLVWQTAQALCAEASWWIPTAPGFAMEIVCEVATILEEKAYLIRSVTFSRLETN